MFRCLIAGLLGLVAIAAQAGPKIEHWTAPSGARVFFIESRVVPIVDVQLDFAAGGAYAAEGKAGVAGLTRSLMGMGAGELDEEQIAERLADTSASPAASPVTTISTASSMVTTMPDRMSGRYFAMTRALKKVSTNRSQVDIA